MSYKIKNELAQFGLEGDENPFDKEYAYNRFSIWDSAFDAHSMQNSYNQVDASKKYAQEKLDIYDEVFKPKSAIIIEPEVDGDELYKCAYDVRYFIENYCKLPLDGEQ